MPAVIVVAASVCLAQAAPPFAPLEQWRSAIAAGDAARLRSMYSSSPPALTMTASGLVQSVDRSLRLFTSFLWPSRLSAFTIEPTRFEQVRPGVAEACFQTTATIAGRDGPQKLYITFAQVWVREPGGWRIISETRTDLSRLPKPSSVEAHIYDEDADAHAEIRQALERARQDHKRVIVVFGANWCYDCHVLDLVFRHSELASLVSSNYEVVHVDVGETGMNRNLDIAQEYHIPLERGIPALAVLDSDGHLLMSQQQGEFEAARRLGPEDIVAFLNRWKG